MAASPEPATPALAVVADAPAALRVAGALFPGVERLLLTRVELRPSEPFAGPLFAALAALPAGACVALVVPVVWSGASEGAVASAPPGPAGEAPAPPPAPALLLPVADHVNLQLRGPLTGPWPAGVPRTFPPMTGVYQPAHVRSRGGAQVYSSGVVVAGVADAERLTAFECNVIRERRLPAFADCLTAPVIAAAYYGLKVAACGVLWHDNHEE